MAVQTDKLMRMFDSDSKIMLETLEQVVREMKGGDSDPGRVDRAFRAAHSIKSEAGFLQLSGVADAAHSLEESLSVLRSGGGTGFPASSPNLTTKLEDLTREISKHHSSEAADAGPAPADRKSVSAGEPLGTAELGILREARVRNERLYRVGVKLTCDPLLYYPRGFLVVNNLEIDCGVVQISPNLDTLKEGSDGRIDIILTTTGNEARLRRSLTIDEVEVTELTELAYDEIETLVDVASRNTDSNGGDTFGSETRAHEEIVLFADELTHLAYELESIIPRSGSGDADLRTLTRRVFNYARVLKSRVDWSSRVQMLDVARELRTRSVGHAARSGKRVQFVVSGGGAMVPAAVADTLTNIMLHLIRNSIDHGFETIQRRAQRGTPPAGTIDISVERIAERVRVRVTDDGDGIDEESVRRNAPEGGGSLLDILATPGFTMHSQPDKSSGRGVGLDSVVHAVRDLLSGEIELDTQTGKGTVITITVPSTSRLVSVLVVESSDGAAALPSALIVQHTSLNPRRLKRDSFGGHYYDFQGESLQLLTVDGQNPSEEVLVEPSVGIVTRYGDRCVVLVCSRVVSTEAVIRDDFRRRRVFSRTLGKEIPFYFPPAYVVE